MTRLVILRDRLTHGTRKLRRSLLPVGMGCGTRTWDAHGTVGRFDVPDDGFVENSRYRLVDGFPACMSLDQGLLGRTMLSNAIDEVIVERQRSSSAWHFKRHRVQISSR